MTTILRKDTSTRYLWLEFESKPDEETRALLYQAGWRWGPFRKQYYNNRRFGKVPESITYEDGGFCSYASERAGRLAVASESASERAEQAAERSNELASTLGGVAVLSTRSKQGKVLEQAEKAKNTAEYEAKQASILAREARGSASHQTYIERPEVIHRRIKRLNSTITMIKNQHHSEVRYRSYEFTHEADAEKKAAILQELKEHKREADEKIAVIRQEIAEHQAKLDAMGGILADRENVEKGDIILWRGERKVVLKINKVSYEVEGYPKREGYWGRAHKIDKTELGMLLQKADGTVINETPMRRGYEAPREVAKPTFVVDEVQTVNIGNASHTSFFPTTQIAMQYLPLHLIPPEARVLEPSAGTGALADVILRYRATARIECCELIYDLQQVLTRKGYLVVGSDFLEYTTSELYDVIVMNPPFQGLTWLTHIEHALSLLSQGGTLIAIVPSGFEFRSEARAQAFKSYVEEHGEWTRLPDEAFKESGANVRTVVLSLTKP